jgi:hypothetical protein
LGAYPSPPVLTYPTNFQTSYQKTAKLIGIDSDADSVSGNAGNAAKHLANGRIILEQVRDTLAAASKAFWSQYDKGILDKHLKNEYAYWLVIGKKYQVNSPSSKTAMSTILNLMATSTAGAFDYPMDREANRDMYQFLKHSKCSLAQSGYAPERLIGAGWLKGLEQGQYKYKDNFDDYSELVKYYAEGPIKNMSSVKGMKTCTSWALSKGNGIDGCLSESSLPFTKVSNTSFSFDLAELLIAKRVASSRSYFDRYPIKAECSMQDLELLVRYLFYTHPGQNNMSHYTNAFASLCKDGSLDIESDLINAHIFYPDIKLGIEAYWQGKESHFQEMIDESNDSAGGR